MKLILLSVILCSTSISSNAQNAEKLIRAYLMGYEKKDWNLVAGQFANDFNFTSPAGDDHISLAVYKERCFPTSKFFKKVEFSKVMVQGNCAFATYDITTTDNKIVHNTEYYTFNKGKIKSIECFFGAGIGYPGSTKAYK
jgi:hypothetical protein